MTLIFVLAKLFSWMPVADWSWWWILAAAAIDFK